MYIDVVSSAHCQLPPFCDTGESEPRKALRSSKTQQRKTAANTAVNTLAASCRVIAIVTLRRSARR